MNRKPKYEALSYSLGDPAVTTTIHICGRPFEATLNLELALQNLWLEEGPRTLWVDAVCIDQADDEERSEQVQMMSGIYKKASRVLVWLGLPFERTYTESCAAH